MDINLIKSVMKEKKMTQKDLSEKTGVPLQTIKYIFTGRTLFPRIDTVQAIEKARGLDKTAMADISAEDMELVELIKQQDEEQTKELSSYVDYLLSKRK